MNGANRGLSPALLRLGLSALSRPYAWSMALRNGLYDAGWLRVERPASVPVVSIGNLTVGGTGKTPAVEYLSRYYQRLNLRVAILSRGYGARGRPNDEALMLEQNLPQVPHLQGANRTLLAKAAAREFGSQVLILDDGFQHRRLARDLDIVLVDATRPWGYGQLLPRGLLREPVESLRRADVVLLTRVSQVKPLELERLRHEVMRLAPNVLLAESVHRSLEWVDAAGQAWPLERVEGRPVAAFCGIGNPAAFRRSLASLTAHVADFRCYADHHAYSRRDVADLEQWAARQSAETVIVTTQKDLVKLRVRTLKDRPLLALRIGLELVSGRDQFERRLQEVVSRSRLAAA